MRIGIIQTFIDYHRRGIPQGGPLQPGIGPLIAALLPPEEDIHVVHETLERPDWTGNTTCSLFRVSTRSSIAPA